MWFASWAMLLFLFEKSLGKTTSREYCELDCVDDGGNTHVNSGCDITDCQPLTHLCDEVNTDIDEFRQAMLTLHNTARNAWAQGFPDKGLPPISNMNVLNWDEDLEHLAKCSANTCFYDWGYCNRTPKFKNAGMNILFGLYPMVVRFEALNQTSYPMWAYMFQNACTTITPLDVTREQEAFYEYTEPWYMKHAMSVQVIWGITSHIGCARSFNSRSDTILTFRIVCFYGPQGNKYGRRMFMRGKTPCSACPSNQKCGKRYPFLCGEQEPIVLSKSSTRNINLGLSFVFILIYKNML